MHKVKSHKSVEEIAKKHRLEVSFVKNQLEMGIPIEHEHTKDKDLATDIALQHLDEIPDYYTRLKKMESDAKKHHKKFKDVAEELDGKSSKDPGYSLRDWFKGGGWVQTGGKYDGKPCAKQPGQTTKPFCRDPDDRANMSKNERIRRSTKKRREDPNPNRSGAAKIVTKEEYVQEKKGEKDSCYHKVKSRYKIWPSAYASGALSKCRKVGADNWGNKTEEVEMVRYCPKCKKDETKSECKYGSKYWEMFSMPSALSSNKVKYDPNRPHPANEEKDHEYSMARSEISTIISAAKRLRNKMKGEGNIEAWVQSKITKAADYIDTAADYLESGEHKVDEECWNGYKKVGMKKKGKKMVPNCVPESISIEDSNGNHYAEFIDIIKPEPLKASRGIGSKLLGEGLSFEIGNKKTTGLGGMTPQDVDRLKQGNPGAAEKIDQKYQQIRKGISLPLAKKETKKEVQVSHYNMKTFGRFMSEANEVRGNLHEFLPVIAAAGEIGAGMVGRAVAGEVAGAIGGAASSGIRAMAADIIGKKVGDMAATKVKKTVNKLINQDSNVNVNTDVNTEEFSDWRSDFGLSEASAAWQRKEGKNPEGGLNKKGIASYRKEHPGSRLSLAVTTEPSKLKKGSKKWKRRKSFCARMSKMPGPMKDEKGRPTRKALSLRKWNC